MANPSYNETVEARRFASLRTKFHTAEEQVVFDAIQANLIRTKAQIGIKLERRREYWEQELIKIEDCLPLDHPVVAEALSEGNEAFYNRVSDRIWAEHKSEIPVPRCPKCECILKTELARQCLWCDHDWH